MRCSFVREMFPLLVNACFHFTRVALMATKDIQQFPPYLSLVGPQRAPTHTHTYTHIHIHTDYTRQSKTHTGQPSLSGMSNYYIQLIKPPLCAQISQ